MSFFGATLHIIEPLKNYSLVKKVYVVETVKNITLWRKRTCLLRGHDSRAELKGAITNAER